MYENGSKKYILHSSILLLHVYILAFTVVSLANVRCMFYLLISPTEIAMGLQAVEQPETIHTAKRVEDACICSSLHVQGNRVNVHYYHRCPLHNDTLEHDCTYNNIVTGQSNFVRFGELPGTISTSEPVEDACICSMLHIQGSSAYKYQYRCPVHNDTEEHNCTRRNTVMGR